MSSIIYSSALISAAVYSQVLVGAGGPGWDSRYGIFGTAIKKVGTIPIILSILLGAIGLFIVVLSIKEELGK